MSSTDTTGPPTAAASAPRTRFRRSADAGALMALSSMTCVQLGLAVSVHLSGRLGPVQTAWLRLAWAGVLLLVLVRPRLRRLPRRDLAACAALGAVTSGLMLLFMCAAARIPLGTASALEFLGPLAVSMYGARGGGRRLWSVLAALGVLLLTEPWHGGTDPAGIAFALASAVCWAAYILLTQRVGDRVTGLTGLAVSIPVAALVATPFAALAAGGTEAGRVLTDWPVLLIGLGLAVLHPVLPFSLEFLALRRLTTTAFGTLMSLEPAVALVIGLLALGQVPGPPAAAGVLFVVAAGIGAIRAGARAPAGAGPDTTGAGAGATGPAGGGAGGAPADGRGHT